MFIYWYNSKHTKLVIIWKEIPAISFRLNDFEMYTSTLGKSILKNNMQNL